MPAGEDVVISAIVKSLALLTDYVSEREVPDLVADDDVKALESVGYYLLNVPDEERPRLISLLGPHMSYSFGLTEDEP